MTYRAEFGGEVPRLIINGDYPDATTKRRAVFAGRLLTAEIDTPTSFDPRNFEPVEIPLAPGTTQADIDLIMGCVEIENQ